MSEQPDPIRIRMDKLAKQMVPTKPLLAVSLTTTLVKVPQSNRLEAAFQGEKTTSAIHQVVRTTSAINVNTLMMMTTLQLK